MVGQTPLSFYPFCQDLPSTHLSQLLIRAWTIKPKKKFKNTENLFCITPKGRIAFRLRGDDTQEQASMEEALFALILGVGGQFPGFVRL